MDDVLTKKAFAAMVGVTPSCVSHWIGEKKLHGPALVGRGCRARVRVPVAIEQLKKNLDISQRLGVNGKAKLDEPAGEGEVDEPDATVEGRIKLQRLDQLALSNAAAREEAAVRSGRYVRVTDARLELGRTVALLLSLFESSLVDFYDVIVARPYASSREGQQALRAAWRDIRARKAKALGAEAAELARLVEGEEAPG